MLQGECVTEVWTREQAKQYLAGNARLGKAKRKHKFGAVPKTVDGIKFPSTAEARRYGQLKLRLKVGEIANLVLQPRYALIVPDGRAPGGEVRVAEYVADFAYDEATCDGGRKVVEDVKGVLTKVYRLKLKMFQAQYPHLTFREIKKPTRKKIRRRK